MLLNTRHLSDLFGISPSTVKKYSGMYGQFLSEKARPQDDRQHRLFDTDDLKVFSYITQQVKLNVPHDEIILALANGARADVPAQYGEYSLSIDKNEQLLLLQTRVSQLQSEIEMLRGERDKRLEFEGQNKLLREMLREKEHELIQLKMKFGDD
jgi:DNA-binding transcriptional MerR regulator